MKVNLVDKLKNLGVTADMHPSMVRKLRLQNMLIYLMVGICLFASLFYPLMDLPTEGLYASIVVVVVMVVLSFMTSIGQHKYSVVFVIQTPALLLMYLTYLFGLEGHFHYMHLCGIGMPLVVYRDDKNFIKWALGGLSFTYFIMSEVYFLNHEPIHMLLPSEANPIRWSNDVLLFVVTILTFYFFTTDMEKQLAVIEDHKGKLETANEELERFSYVVSHDLKAPLVTINSFSKLIRENKGDQLDEEGLKMFGFIEDKAQHMNNLITAVLDYSTSGRSSKEKELVDVKAIVDDMSEVISIKSNVDITTSEWSFNIYAHKSQLEQVILNLIDNAAKYNDKDDAHINVCWKASDDKFLRFSVKDNGPGIPENFKTKIFEPFKTVNGQTPDSTGIGLSIVKKLVEQNGGEIELSSEQGQGTIFQFTWDIRQA